MKKAIALIVALLLVISLSTFVLTGCNHDDDDIILEGDGDIQRDADGNIIYNNVKLSMWSVTTGDDKINLAFTEQIAGVISELSLEKYCPGGDRGLNAYVFGEPENKSTFLKFVKRTSGLVHYVNKYKLVAYDFVYNYPLTEFMDDEQIDYATATVKSGVSLNVALIGFGKANRQIFLTSVENNQFMSIEDGKFVPKAVNYWIYDKKDARNDKNLNHDYYRFERELGQDEYLPLPCKPANEKFFELDINDDDFYKSLKENLSEKKRQEKLQLSHRRIRLRFGKS